jgi:hypothetical protein
MFDTLSIGVKLTDSLRSAGRSEIHLFAYLACLLALYETKPVTEWEYSFVGTQDGAPFSPDLNESIDALIRSGGLIPDSDATDFYATGAEGRTEYEALRGLDSLISRERYLEAACASLLSIPVGRVRMGLHREPSLSRVARGKPARQLLEGIAFDELYEQLKALSETLGDVVTDLLVPAVVWLSYLAKDAEEPVSEMKSESTDVPEHDEQEVRS